MESCPVCHGSTPDCPYPVQEHPQGLVDIYQHGPLNEPQESPDRVLRTVSAQTIAEQEGLVVPDGASPQTSSITAPLVSDVARRKVVWLWRGWIPRGKLTIFDGDPGLGKSVASLDLAARVSTGSPLPDGTRLEGPAGVVMMSAEDDISDTIRPRLEAHGADIERIRVFVSVGLGDDARPPTLIGDLPEIERLITEAQAHLLVVDPWSAFISAQVDTHRDPDVRRTLHLLSAMAIRTGVAVLLIRHLNKDRGSNPLYRGGGSIGIIGAARSGIMAAPDPSDESRIIMAVTKSNLALKPQSLAYKVLSNEEFDCAEVSWQGTSDLTAAQLLGSSSEAAPKRAEAEEMLETLLADGPRMRSNIEEQAKLEGISLRTLRRAQEALGIISEQPAEPGKIGRGPAYWRLPNEQTLGGQGLVGQSTDTQMANQETAGQSTDLGLVGQPGGVDKQTPNCPECNLEAGAHWGWCSSSKEGDEA